jgi:predicted anti-sigma-YlaC factor YlaD
MEALLRQPKKYLKTTWFVQRKIAALLAHFKLNKTGGKAATRMDTIINITLEVVAPRKASVSRSRWSASTP